MLQPQRNIYLETAVQTATPAQLLIMLYDGAIRFCRMGIEALKKADYQAANDSLLRCQDIIREFMVTLDRNFPVSEHLSRLYEYFLYLLIQANLKKDVKPAEEVLGYLLELKETWMMAQKTASHTQKVGVQHG